MSGVFVITIEAVPAPGSAAFNEVGGAYVNVFVANSTEAQALATAQREIEEVGWKCKSTSKVVWVQREDFADDEEGIEYFDQALIDDVVLVFHTFPIQPDDEDVVH